MTRPGTDDNNLVDAFRSGDQAAATILVLRYQSLVAAIAEKYFLPGATREDVIAEGMVGFTRALHDYQPDRGVAFKAFAMTCVERMMISAVKTANRKKHGALNDAIPLAVPLNRNGADQPDSGAFILEETIPGRNTEREAASRDTYRQVKERIATDLSPGERTAAIGMMLGATYDQISVALHRPGAHKPVDNALQRARRKLRPVVYSGEESQ